MAEIQIQGETINQRPEKTQLDGTEALLLQDAEGTKHAKVTTLKTFVQPELSGYVTEDEQAQALKGYVTKEELDNLNIEDLVMYGIERDKTVSSPDCTRIGNPNLHRTLPVHSLMRGCLLNDDGSVNKYLDASTWESETRDGSQGQVMVEVPDHSFPHSRRPCSVLQQCCARW